MNDQQPSVPSEVGAYLRARRAELGLSTRALAEKTGLEQPTIVRIETGQSKRPRPDILTKLASALGLGTADVFARANYTAPTSLPTLRPYLRTKYQDLPPEDVSKIEAYAARLAKRHGISLAGPEGREDESS